MKQFIERLKTEKFYVWGVPTIPLFYVSLAFLGWLTFLSVTNWVNRDKWQTLVHEQSGFSVDHPANWTKHVFDRGQKNSDDLRLILNNRPLFSTKTLRIYWLPLENPTEEELSMWGQEKVSIVHDKFVQSKLEKVVIGLESYPALKQTFQIDNDFTKYIHYYVVSDNGSYLLRFYFSYKSQEAEALSDFDQILNSFRIIDARN